MEGFPDPMLSIGGAEANSNFDPQRPGQGDD